MKIILKLSKTANFFFFVSNLSEWHFSCRKTYNEAWLKKTGPLKAEEKKVLLLFKKIMKRRGFSRDKDWQSEYLGKYFYLFPKESVWRELKKTASEKEIQQLKMIFDVVRPRFEKIWKSYDPGKRVSIIERYIHSRLYTKLLDDLGMVFGGKKSMLEKLNVVIIVSPLGKETTAAGGANTGPSSITLELPSLRPKTWQLDFSAMILAHEIAHSLFERRGGAELISKSITRLRLPKTIKNLPEGFSTMQLINEALTGSFVPLGYFGQKYTQFRLAPLLLNDLNKGLIGYQKLSCGEKINYYNELEYYLIPSLYSLAIIYGRNKKSIDRNFVLEVAKTIKTSLRYRSP